MTRRSAKKVAAPEAEKMGPRVGPWSLWPLIPRLFPYLRPYRGLAASSIFLSVVAILIGLAEPWPLAFMVDNVLGNHSPPAALTELIGKHDRTTLLVLAALAGLALVAVRNLITVVHEYVNTKLHQHLVLDFRSDLFEHAQRLSVSYHDATPTGQLMSQINTIPDQAGGLLIGLPPLVQSVITLIGMFIIAITIDPVLALLALTVVPVIYYSVGIYSSRIVPRLQYVRGLEWQTMSIVFEAMAMLRVIAAFARERYEFGRFRSQGVTAANARVKLTVRQTVFSLVVNTWTAAGTALVLGVGAFHVLTGQLTIGELLVFLAYIAAVYGPLETISSTVGSMQQQLVSLQGAFYLLDSQPDIADEPDAIELRRAWGAIAFDHVDFSYAGRHETLKEITFSVLPGQHVAIVGPTGAGKTTLVSMIKRFHDPKAGSVLVDGLDVRKLKVRSLREQVSVVLQNPELFSGSIAENIRYGRLEAEMSEVIEAAKAANAHDFISGLPKGYDTELGEGGAQLSVGERQRICVARAFLKDAPILILDEPTSSIDSRTEAVILDALDRLSVGRTTFVIAHRLSTIRNVDVILVLDHGQLVERGTHDELLAQGGLYRQLYDVQMGVDLIERLSRRVISSELAPAAVDRSVERQSLVAQVQRSLATALKGTIAHDEPLGHAAALLVQAVEPMLDPSRPEATRILAALRSANPLAEPAIAAAFSDALLELQDLAADLGVAAREAYR
jgi:ATP-binding cassette subfamily B protein/subfamily B ATP-binding cassette protein MsbA